MSVIPNKYLSNSGNRIENGPSALLRADNIRVFEGRISKRRGQDLVIPQDPAFQSITGSYAGYRPVKTFFYNGRVWAYFYDSALGSPDIIGYYDPTRNQWIGSQMYDYGNPVFWYDDANRQPQMVQSQRRLLVSTKLGIYTSPKLQEDQLINNRLQSIQTKIQYAGAPPAVPLLSISLIDTAATYNSNWLPANSSAAYRHVWKYIDANGIQIYGAPSDWKQIKNTAGAARAVQMRILIPIDALSGQPQRLVCQIYRSERTSPGLSGITPSPSDELYFVSELRPTTSDLSTGYMDFIDIIDDAALQFPLYTNETQQGIAAARTRAPISACLDDFNGCAFYGNIKNRWSLPFQLVSVVDTAAVSQQGLADSDIVVVGDFALQAKTTVAITNNQFALDNTTGYTNQFTRITNTAFNLASKYNNNRASRSYFNLMLNSGPNQITGQFQLQQIRDASAPSGYVPYIGLYRQGGWSATSGSSPSPIVPTPLVTETIGKGFKLTRVRCAGAGGNIIFTLNAAPDFAVGDTVNIARAVVYQDLALPAGSQGDNIARFTPGQYVVSNITGTDVELSGVTGSGAFNQQVGVAPFATTWSNLGAMHCVKTADGFISQAIGVQNSYKNRIMFSAYQQPQNAPPLNYFDIGSSDKQIITMFALNKSLFIFKEDGLFRLSGDYPEFYVQQFDPNCILLGADLATTMGSALYAMTTRGVYEITQNSMRRISNDINNQLSRTIWPQPDKSKRYGFAVGHEQDHYVSFWLPRIDVTKTGPVVTTTPYIAYVFDGQGWTRRTDQAMGACCGIEKGVLDSQYRLYTMKNYGSGWLTKERKQFNGYDYSDQKIPCTFSLIDSFTIEINATNDSGSLDTFVSQVGDILVGAVVMPTGSPQLMAYIDSFVQTGAQQYQVTLTPADPTKSATDWGAIGSVDLYLPIKSQWQYGINTDQDPTIRKHFSEVGIMYQQPYFSYGDIGFSSDIFPNVEYLSNNIAGFWTLNKNPANWPLFTFDTDLQDKSIRAVVATKHQRCSQLRISVRHGRAIEFISCYGYYYRATDGGKAIQR